MSVQGPLRCPDRVIKVMQICMISMPHNIYMAFLCQGKTSPIDWKKDFLICWPEWKVNWNPVPNIYLAFLCQGKTSPIDWKKDFFYFRLLRWCLDKAIDAPTLAFRHWFQTIKCLLQITLKTWPKGIEVIRLLPLELGRRPVRPVRTLEIYWVPLIEVYPAIGGA